MVEDPSQEIKITTPTTESSPSSSVVRTADAATVAAKDVAVGPFNTLTLSDTVHRVRTAVGAACPKRRGRSGGIRSPACD